MLLKSAAIAALGVACAWGQAYAQSAALPRLSDMQGAVLVDHGDGFVAANSQTVLRGGDRITATRGGLVKLAYSDGCSVTVNSRSMATIDSVSPCAGGSSPRVIKTATDDTAAGGGAAGGGGGAGALGWLALAGGLGAGVGAILGSSHNYQPPTPTGGQSESP